MPQLSTPNGGTWLSVTPASGNASGQAAGSISVSVNPTGLAAGIYSGDVNVSIGSLLQSVNVTFVVHPGDLPVHHRRNSRAETAAAGCTASKLAITETGLANNFAVPAGWPATLIVQLNDDCASPVTNGNVVASFSNGDAPLNLVGRLARQLLRHLAARRRQRQHGGHPQRHGRQLCNPPPPSSTAESRRTQTPPPTLAPGGTLNNLNPVVGAPLAPGTIAQVYGSGLAAAPVSTGVLPCPPSFNNTFALVGPSQAPLYFLSSGQINLQIPNEVTGHPTDPHRSQRQQRTHAASDAQYRSGRARRIVLR